MTKPLPPKLAERMQAIHDEGNLEPCDFLCGAQALWSALLESVPEFDEAGAEQLVIDYLDEHGYQPSHIQLARMQHGAMAGRIAALEAEVARLKAEINK